MMTLNIKNREEYIYYLFFYLKQADREQFRNHFLTLHPTDQCYVFRQLNQERRKLVYQYLSPSELTDVFQGLERKQQQDIFEELDRHYRVSLLNELSADDAADFFEELPNSAATALFHHMSLEDAKKIKNLLSYNKETAGAIMTTEYVSVSPTDSVSHVLERLRMKEGKEAETIYYLYVVDDTQKLIGVVSLRDLITASRSRNINELMKSQVISVTTSTSQKEVAGMIADYNLLAIPVVTKHGELVGIVTFDDITHILEDPKDDAPDIEGTETKDGGTNTSLLATMKKRSPWIIAMIFIGFLAGQRIEILLKPEPTILVILALFVVLITNASRNIGVLRPLFQVVRTLTVKELDGHNLSRMLKREWFTGWLIGLESSIVLFALIFIFYRNLNLSLWVSITLLGTLMLSKGLGILSLYLLHRWNRNPAVAIGPLIMTISNMLGMLLYFFIASQFHS
jgi:magnesium transporter